MRAPANWKKTNRSFTAPWWGRVRQHLHFTQGTSRQRELEDAPKVHVGSLWHSKRSHDFQTSRISPSWHRLFFPSFTTKAWLRPLALGSPRWPTLHPDLSPGVVRALEFLCGLLSAGSWQQLRAYQMPGWWVSSKHTDRQFLWFCFFVYARKTSPNSSSNSFSSERHLEPWWPGRATGGRPRWNARLQHWAVIEMLGAQSCLHLPGWSWINLSGLDPQPLCFLWLPSKSTRSGFRFL